MTVTPAAYDQGMEIVERIKDLWAGVGFAHLGHPKSPSGQQPLPWCGSDKDGAQVVWWFTPTCRKCARLADAQPWTEDDRTALVKRMQAMAADKGRLSLRGRWRLARMERYLADADAELAT